jgi:hypothetical protein
MGAIPPEILNIGLPPVPEKPIVGTSPSNAGVVGQSNTGVGVWGQSMGDPAVVGGSSGGDGVRGDGKIGVHGRTFSEIDGGVVGENLSVKSKALGILGGTDRVFNQHAGVYGESDQQGVFGNATTPTGTGVYGFSKG